jgi:hypothetical protein
MSDTGQEDDSRPDQPDDEETNEQIERPRPESDGQAREETGDQGTGS